MGSYKEISDTGITYSKNDVLGKGTYGEVYRGVFNGERVAVKKILSSRSEKEEREVSLQIKLDHTNVLAIRKVAEDDDFRYIVLELCAGTLEEVIDKTFEGPKLPPDQVVLYEIADGLDYIHSQRLVHRDIKPENILISLSGQMKLSDFGLSKQTSTRDTCSMSGLKGTLLWMAPELRGNNEPNKATSKCDVFPCGCVFFVFLTRENGGIHPFGDKQDHLQVQINIREGNPVNIVELRRDHFAAAVIQQMLEIDPSIRTSSEKVKRSFLKLLPPLPPNSFIPNVNISSKTDQMQQQKKIYDRQFLLELRNKTGNEKPEGLPSLEIVRDRPKKVGPTGSIPGRPTQGNNQFFNRPIRPGNQHMPRPPMAGGAINPNHPPNGAQADFPALNQPVLFVIGDHQFNKQSPYLQYPANPPAYYQQSGNLPPGNVTQPVRMPSLVWQAFQQPRATQQTYGYRPSPPYPGFPMHSSPGTPPGSSGASRRVRSSALRIVDTNTNRDVLTGEIVPPSAVVTPTTTTSPEITTRGTGAAVPLFLVDSD